MINRSLVGKLWLTMIILVIVVMFLLGVFLSQFFEDFYFSVKSGDLEKNGVKIAEMVTSSPGLGLQKQLSLIASYTDAQIVITDRAGLISASTLQSPGVQPGEKFAYPDVERILKGEVVAQRGTYPGIDMTVLSVGVPIKRDDHVIGAVLLHSPVEPVTRTVQTVRQFILIGAVATIFLATILGFLLSKRLTKPILDMNRVTLEMARGNFQERVDSSSRDELGMLGRTINFLSSELQKNLDALSTEKEQLENILTSMTDAVITFDTEGRMLLLNPPAEKMFPIPGEKAGDPVESLGSPDLTAAFGTVLRENTGARQETRLGDNTYIQNVIPLRHENGETRGVLAVFHDITREKRLEQLRRDFVANVSHELRSPLSLLQGYVEALVDGLADNEEERHKYLNILLDETLRLRRLVNDLLDLTQLETGHLAMKKERLPVHQLVLRVTDRFKPLFDDRQQQLEVHMPDDLPPIIGDEDRLQQVLVNLLDNAAKYTPEHGTVRVGAEARPGMVEIFVVDSGSGIPANDLDYIWERFYKVDKARTRDDNGGTGLGLAIAKTIVLAHGGEVGVTSNDGQGTKFFFRIPTPSQV